MCARAGWAPVAPVAGAAWTVTTHSPDRPNFPGVNGSVISPIKSRGLATRPAGRGLTGALITKRVLYYYIAGLSLLAGPGGAVPRLHSRSGLDWIKYIKSGKGRPGTSRGTEGTKEDRLVSPESVPSSERRVSRSARVRQDVPDTSAGTAFSPACRRIHYITPKSSTPGIGRRAVRKAAAAATPRAL